MSELPPAPLPRDSPDPISDNSATINPSSSQSEQKMSNTIDLPDDPEIAPTHHFVEAHPAHYQQGAFYPRGNGSFAADQEMQMAQELSHNMQQGVGDGTPTSAPRIDSQGQNHAIDMSQTPMGPGMGPPHNRQSFSSNQQTAVEGTPGETMGDGKRKRSKVSRACDECRRKKIRCDATDDDGTVKTCSNCSRINTSCSFSRVPMKRGPSKGYIKELSERVQQVESLQMQLAGQPAGYRQSIDSEYSPDEPYSAGRRNFSFSDNRNPFAAYPRDRIPSTGGWGVGSPTTPYQSRDTRGSVALAPDQHPGDINGPLVSYAKPFWAQDTEVEGRVAKRQKTSTDDEMGSAITNIEQESLAVYFDTIHHIFPILPKQAIELRDFLKDSSNSLTHAFTHVLYTAQRKALPAAILFRTYGEVEDYVWSQAKILPSTRTTKENLMWLWTYIFMIFNTEKDLSKLRGTLGGLSQATLAKLAYDLDVFLNSEAPFRPGVLTQDSEFILIRRAHHVVSILSTLHSLASGTQSLIPPTVMEPGAFEEMSSILPTETALLGRACSVLDIIDTSISFPVSWKTAPSFALRNKHLIQQHLSYVFASSPQDPELDALCRQIQSLVVILLARHTSITHPLEILRPTLELADTLLANTTATQMVPKYNPLDMHLFSLTVMTLLEFTESIDDDIAASAQEGVAIVRRALEQIAERAIADAPEDQGQDSMHWSSCLLRIIATRGASTTKSNGTTITGEKDPTLDPAMAERTTPALLQGQTMSALAAATASGVDGQGDKMMDVKMGMVQVVDMSFLLKKGYLNVVGELCGM